MCTSSSILSYTLQYRMHKVTCIKSGTPYASTKAAMNQITGNWACEWGKDGIRVNCVTPWVSALTHELEDAIGF